MTNLRQRFQNQNQKDKTYRPQNQEQEEEFFLQDTFNKNNKDSQTQVLKLSSFIKKSKYDGQQQQQSRSKMQSRLKKFAEQTNNLQEKQTRIKISDSFQKSYLNRKKSNYTENSIILQSSINERRVGSMLYEQDNRSRSKSPINKQTFSISKNANANQNTNKIRNIEAKTTEQQIQMVKKQIAEKLFLIQLQDEVHRHLIELLKAKDKGKNIIKQTTSQKLYKLYDQIGDFGDCAQNYVSSMKKLQTFVQ